MMAAAATAERQAKASRDDLIGRFLEAYDIALEEARASAVTTETERWQQLYADHRDHLRKQCAELARNLRAIADTAERGHMHESDEKELGEVKKASLALRELHYAFEFQTVSPVKKPVDDCENIISNARNNARQQEEQAPLVNRGLLDEMGHAIKTVHRVRWDAEKGRVLIEGPSGK